MHDINYSHKHELDEHDFSGCCKDCHTSVVIIKPHIMAFAARIKHYTRKMLAALQPDEVYRLYQILDDLAHMDTGSHLAGLLLEEPDINKALPIIRSYYSTFFDIHEAYLAKKLLKTDNPWETLKAFPLYPRYDTLIRNQVKARHITNKSRLVFIGCGAVPMSLILLSRLYGIRSIGLESSKETAKLSTKVIQSLGLEKEVEIIHSDDLDLEKLDWDIALVAALAEPKARIFKSLGRILEERKDAFVIFRTYTGMRAVLYEPVQPADIKGFKIVKEIFPTGRVNNTTVFAELEG
ncbi:MAG: class I SAM-dependent methyltransferase [Desulfosarcina sp.]|nr:class I SAM-dependent methyltransferase [Desulfobacterales bacterium]